MYLQATDEREQALIEHAREANPAFARILDVELPAVIERFAQACLDYGDGAQDLGMKGQFADLNRKFLKLRRFMWEDKTLIGESPEVVLADLIAHCFLTLDMLPKPEPAVAVAGTLCQNVSCLINEPHFAADHQRWALS